MSYVGTWECLKFSTFCDCHRARNNEVDLHLQTINEFDFVFHEALRRDVQGDVGWYIGEVFCWDQNCHNYLKMSDFMLQVM